LHLADTDAEDAIALSAQLAPLWSLYDRSGGISVMACATAVLGGLGLL
jgi:4-hydroxy-tetrahydrodipicolinate synthase